MEFKIIDETAYGLYQDMDFESVTRWDDNEWKCETANGFHLNIKIKGGTLYADLAETEFQFCLLYTSPSPRDRTRSRMPSSA